MNPAASLDSDIFLMAGQMSVHAQPVTIRTILGSCVAVCLWDSVSPLAGMNHYLLPYPLEVETADDRFGSVSIPRLIRAMWRKGAQSRNLQAAVIGGGSPLAALGTTAVGDGNVEVAKAVLGEQRIPIVRQDTGGAHGRKVLFKTVRAELCIEHVCGWP
ncbi:MAG: chemotaxis protein CheD [Planctomycetota bacterium]